MTNTTRQVVLGDSWEYFDPEEGWVTWRVDEIDGDTHTGTLRKQTGKDPGFPAREYPLEHMRTSPRWRWQSGTAEPEVMFACPHCGLDKPIPDDDYVCGDCRLALDNVD